MFFALRGEKKRFVLPANFRKLVIASSADQRLLGLTLHHKWKCLIGFGLSREEEFDAIVRAESERQTKLGHDFDADGYLHSLSGFAEVPFDPSGRWVVPEYLCDVSGIEEEMFLHGALDHFTLWRPEHLYAMGSTFDAAKAACRRMQAEARAGKKK